MNAPREAGLTVEQHAARADAVGASEVYDALFNPAPLWLKKTGREPAQDDDALSRLGLAIEPFIIGECARMLNLEDVRKPDTLRRGPHMVAHLDAVARWHGDLIAVEAKWRGSRDGWGDPGTSAVPQSILLQTMAQMHIAELKLALVPVLFLRPPVAVYEVAYDVELGAMIEAGVDRFWRYVESDTPPPVDVDQPEALSVLRKLYPGTDGRRIVATRELEHWRTVCQQAADKAKSYEQVSDVAKGHLLQAMRGAAELEFADGVLLRRKLTKRKGYTVSESEYIDSRFVKPRSTEHAE